jgi:hypothetical protein
MSRKIFAHININYKITEGYFLKLIVSLNLILLLTACSIRLDERLESLLALSPHSTYKANMSLWRHILYVGVSID